MEREVADSPARFDNYHQQQKFPVRFAWGQGLTLCGYRVRKKSSLAGREAVSNSFLHLVNLMLLTGAQVRAGKGGTDRQTQVQVA
jgi:hypothetical protein